MLVILAYLIVLEFSSSNVYTRKYVLIVLFFVGGRGVVRSINHVEVITQVLVASEVVKAADLA